MPENNTANNINQTTPADTFLDPHDNQELSPPKSKFPLFSVIILIVLSVVSVIAVYLFLQVRELTMSQPFPSPSPVPIASSDPTASWQTYSGTNTLNFKYPSEYNLKETKDSINLQNNPTRALLYVSLISNPKSLPVDKWFESQPVDIRQSIVDTHIRSEIMVDNKPAFQFAKQDDSQDFLIVFVHGNQGYLAYFGPSSDEEVAISNQILSTFKFTDNELSNFPKKHFLSSDKFFANYSYPSEITNLKDEKLIGFSCSNKYVKQIDGSFTFYNNDSQQNQQEILSDKSIIKYLVSQKADSVIICTTDSGKKLLEYEIIGTGGGSGASVYYGYFEDDSITAAEIPMEQGPYFSCSDILAITNENILYGICGSGDGGYGSKSLYKVRLSNALGSKLMYKCTSTIDGDSQENMSSCGTTQ